jgi:hypothetical protein
VTSGAVGRWGCSLLALGALAACERPAQSTAVAPRPAISANNAGRDADSSGEIPARSTQDAAPAPVVGITHEELLRRADAEGQDASEPAVEPEGASIPEDTWFADETGVEAQRTRYEMRFPDERADRPSVERVLRVDDQGDRIVALLYGTGFVIAPGYRIGGRASMSAWALVAADQRSHRALNPDELRQWFFGQAIQRSVPLSFRRSDDGLTATRGQLSLSLQFDPASPARALSCRMFVSLVLGGDSAAIRTGCEGAKVPARVTLRARGLPVLAFDKAETSAVHLPRNALAVPPRDAVGQTLAMPQRGGEGGFFTPNELLALEPVRPANAPPVQRRPGWAPTSSQFEVVNSTQSEVLLFVDDTAIGWLAAGRTATFAGVQTGRHSLRARSIDGMYRVEPVALSAPARWEVGAAPRPAR